jgi:hypothetical protein
MELASGTWTAVGRLGRHRARSELDARMRRHGGAGPGPRRGREAGVDPMFRAMTGYREIFEQLLERPGREHGVEGSERPVEAGLQGVADRQTP